MSDWSSGYITDLGYTHGFYRELTPRLLEMVALVRGCRSPNTTEPLRYCELGCGQGFSVNLLAAANPRIEFHATDFNPAQIAAARDLAGAAGNANLHLYEDSFAEFLARPELPEFDIICLHGVYSWIAPEHRATIVEIARRKLKAGGLFYNSYNTLPGWAAPAPMRHLLYLHGSAQGGPTAGRLDPALGFIQKLVDANAGYFRVNAGVKDRLEKLRGQSRNYLAHEYLNETWTPMYHSDVAGDLANAKLAYAGSAALLENVDSINLLPDQQTIMNGIADPVFRETVRDYMVNQQFRRDVFVKGLATLTSHDLLRKWMETRFVLSVLREDLALKAQGGQGEASLHKDTYEPVADALAAAPKTLAELAAVPHIAKLGRERLLQAMVVLMGTNQAQPCLDAAGDQSRAKRTRAFNQAVLAHAESSSDLQFLASPLTGGGFGVDRFQQLSLLALQKKADGAHFSMAVLKRQNQRVMKDGKPLESDEENLAELAARNAVFIEKRLPILQRLGIA